jgi:hypothetical protein
MQLGEAIPPRLSAIAPAMLRVPLSHKASGDAESPTVSVLQGGQPMSRKPAGVLEVAVVTR